jgi:acetyl-CoA acyltransferase
VETNPAVYMGMGLTAEQVAKEFDVSREDQDEFALRSHNSAKEAVESGRFDEEIVPMEVKLDWVDDDGEPQHMETTFKRDEGPRDTSKEKLGKLPTVFQQDGTVTAGNSSQRSDGAAAVVVMERERAEELGLEPLARFVGFAVGGVRPEVMGIGPTVAIPKVLKLTGLSLDDIDLIEFNEAFAAQVLAVIREVGLDLEKTNVNGGAIALGHPMGATGTKLTVQLMSEMKRRDSKYGMVTMCIGGGMGAAGYLREPAKLALTCRLLAVRFFGWPLDLRKRRGRGGFVNGSEWNHQYLDTNGIEIHYVRHGASLPLCCCTAGRSSGLAGARTYCRSPRPASMW